MESKKENMKMHRIRKRVLIPVCAAVIVVIMAIAVFLSTEVSQKKALNNMLTDGSWINMTDNGNITVLKFENNQMAYTAFSLDETGNYNGLDEIRCAYKVKSLERFSANGKNYNVKQTEDGIEIFPSVTSDNSEKGEKWIHINED